MKKIFICCAAALMFASTQVSAEISLRYGFSIDGSAGELIAFVKKANELQAKINPGAQQSALFMDTFHGPNSGGASLVLVYEDMTAFAKSSSLNEASAEWGAHMQSFPGNVTLEYSGMSNVAWMEEGVNTTSGGEVLVIFGMDIVDGGVGALVEFARKAAALQEELGLDTAFRVSVPIAAGSNTGGAVVAIKHASAAAWAENTATLNASEKWQELIATFPTDNYQANYQGMSTAAAL